MPLSFRSLLRRKKTLRMPPPALLSLYYMAFIILGAILLWLPISHHGDIGLGEALFTSTSAVTVTGLVLADTGATFTGFGQAVIAALIQLGGLGLMTFAVLLLGALGIPIGMPQRLILRGPEPDIPVEPVLYRPYDPDHRGFLRGGGCSASGLGLCA